MRILLTGGSSFTGSWFARTLADAGHAVTATFRSPLDAYEGVRGKRVAAVAAVCEAAPETGFGDQAFAELLDRGADVVCHHGAELGDYRSASFDVEGAVRRNTSGLDPVLAALAEQGAAFVLTGTVFESGEGEGEPPLEAFSPYGLSKTLTAEAVSSGCAAAGVRLGKFVIANPFGPWEEARFTSYLARTWLAGETARVQTPAYVRDNIHVSLLARAYSGFVEEVAAGKDGFSRLNPSGYVSTQGEFTERMARGLEPRLGVRCVFELAEQKEFSEPLVRVNTDRLDSAALGWDESAAWDELAAWYRATIAPR